VLYPIFGVSVLAWYVGLGKILYLRRMSCARKLFTTALHEDFREFPREGKAGFVPYDVLLMEIGRQKGDLTARATNAFREFLADVVPDLEQGFSTLSACVSVAPLLGLLGTISGMNRMFSVITDVGLGSPGLMAGGISVALESALTGLAVAVASMFLHNYLFNKKNIWVHLLMKDGEQLVNWASNRQDPWIKE
jgi:biopolymer transport protein ExbB/TolQ